MSQAEQQFVRHTAALFVACHWEKPSLDRAIELAKNLWQRLDAHTDKPSGKGRSAKPREPEQDYYQQLNDRQRQAFDAFWRGFGFKQGRNGAAMRFLQLGEVSDEEYRHIINAAKAESNKTLPAGQSRKMAQGWLAERRWLDYVEPGSPPASQAQERAVQYAKLQNDLVHAKRMSELLTTTDEVAFWQAEAAQVLAKIEVLRHA